jgi:hypothetical protein
MNAYWKQWDRDDLDSWQGKKIASVREDEEDIAMSNILECERNCVHNPMYEYGLTRSMFI